jgi:hypothetical protein
MVNNTVVSNFASVDRMDLLQLVFGKIYLTPEVHEEVVRGISSGHTFLTHAQQEIGPEDSRWLQLTTYQNQVEFDLYLSLCEPLDFGEASCLAIAKSRGWLFLTDDRAARRLAGTLNVDVSGTLGVLKLAVESDLLELSEGNDLLQQMIRGRYRSPIDDLSEIIEQGSP